MAKPHFPKYLRNVEISTDNSHYSSQGPRGLIQMNTLGLSSAGSMWALSLFEIMSLWLPWSCFSVLSWCKSFGTFNCLHFPNKHTEWKHTTEIMHQDVLHPSCISMLWVFSLRENGEFSGVPSLVMLLSHYRPPPKKWINLIVLFLSNSWMQWWTYNKK